MNRFGSYLVRLLRVAIGFIAGLAVAAAMVVILDLNKGGLPEPLAGAAAIGFFTFLAARMLWPLLLVLLLTEVMRWRALALHLGLGLSPPLRCSAGPGGRRRRRRPTRSSARNRSSPPPASP